MFKVSYIYACTLRDIEMTTCWPTEGVFLLLYSTLCMWMLFGVGVSLGRHRLGRDIANAMSLGVGVRCRCCGRIVGYNVDIGVDLGRRIWVWHFRMHCWWGVG